MSHCHIAIFTIVSPCFVEKGISTLMKQLITTLIFILFPIASLSAECEIENLLLCHNADKGDATAQTMLAGYYQDGYEVKQDYQKAAFWYQKAAEQGNAFAQGSLGSFYYNGYGVKKDDEKAFYWFKKGAEQGDLRLQATIALWYYNGQGDIKVNYQKAAYWYQKAADQGHLKSKLSLAKMYESGIGVKQDKKLAKELFNIVCNSELHLGCEDYQRLNN